MLTRRRWRSDKALLAGVGLLGLGLIAAAIPADGIGTITACDPATTPHPPGARSGQLLVTNQQARSVSLVDLESGTVVHLRVDGAPHGGAISPDGRWGVVADYGVLQGSQLNGNRLFVIDLAARRIVRTILTGEYRALHDVAFVPGRSDRVVVTAQRNQHVLEVDIERGVVLGALDTRGVSSHTLAIAGDARTIFTANEEELHISRLDLAGHRFVAHVALDKKPLGLGITPDGREVWVGLRGAVAVVDAERNAVTTVIPGAEYPDDIAVSRDGRRVVIADMVGNQVLIADATARRIVGRVAVERPHSVDIHPDARIAFATLGRADAVAVIDVERQCVLTQYPVQRWPDEVSWGPKPVRTPGD